MGSRSPVVSLGTGKALTTGSPRNTGRRSAPSTSASANSNGGRTRIRSGASAPASIGVGANARTLVLRPRYYRWCVCISLVVLIGLVSAAVALLSLLNDQPSDLNVNEAPPEEGGGGGSGGGGGGGGNGNSEVLCEWCDGLADRLGAGVGGIREQQQSGASVHCTELGVSDFAAGTYIMDTPSTCYVLVEDIVFHPAEDNDFRATRPPYNSSHAFVLDFFAAVAVQAPGVVLDLGGYEIRQSEAHYLQQRFFACIELADRPFIRGQGPADFSGSDAETDIGGAAQFTLRNGRLGLASHHGIHGNGAWNVLIEDTEIVDYEVAAISLNGVHDVMLNRVHALGTSLRVPVIGSYSNARFLMPFVDRTLALAAGNASLATHAARLQTASEALQARMDEAFQDIVQDAKPTVDPEAHPDAHRLFGNPSGLIDGNTYGFVLHSHGVAVNGFNCDRSNPSTSELHHVLAVDCKVSNTRGKVAEVIALAEVDTGGVQRGPAGDVLRIAEVLDGSSYEGHALADTQIALGALARAMGLQLGTLQIHPFIENWALHDAGSLATAVANDTFEYKRNGDTMFHTNKGVFGIRVDGGHHIAIVRTDVQTVENFGDAGHVTPLPGETLEDAYYTRADDGGHPAQDPQAGYMGADTRGISFAATSNVLLDTVSIRGVHSRMMWSHGLDVFNDATNVHLHDVAIFNVTAFTDTALRAEGPKSPRAAGLCTSTSAEEPTRSGSLIIEDVRAGHIGLACNTLHESAGIDACTAPDVNFYGMNIF